jgi:Na+-transporting NADH:ubiquinone oxidoreductase subunit NqrF
MDSKNRILSFSQYLISKGYEIDRAGSGPLNVWAIEQTLNNLEHGKLIIFYTAKKGKGKWQVNSFSVRRNENNEHNQYHLTMSTRRLLANWSKLSGLHIVNNW